MKSLNCGNCNKPIKDKMIGKGAAIVYSEKLDRMFCCKECAYNFFMIQEGALVISKPEVLNKIGFAFSNGLLHQINIALPKQRVMSFKKV